MVRSRGAFGGPKQFLFCLFVFSLSIRYLRCKPQSISYFLPVPLNSLYVPQYESVAPTAVPLNPLFIYYIIRGFHQPIIDVPIMPQIGHQLIRNDDPYPQILDYSEDRDAPARTPIQDSAVYKGTEVTFQQDQCGTKETLVRNNDDTKENGTIRIILKESGNLKLEGGTILLESLDFSGPNTTETAFSKYSGTPLLISNKITYGVETRNKESPWQVAMFINGKFHCGASLIGELHVLTAAHCVTAYTTRPHILDLSIGDWDLLTTDDGTNIKASVKKVTTHDGFNFYNLQNDIAILELKEKVTFTDRIKPICLPPVDLGVEGMPITITGWGRNERNHLQTKLRKLTAFALKNTVCADRWSSSGAPRSLIGARTICMDTQFGDSCKGDSGGPAVMEHPSGSGKYVQAGIVSFGSGSCTDFNLPGVYTRVASFRNWIIDKIA